MNRRILGNILLAVILILSVSGLVLYFTPHQKATTSIHTLFGFVFLLSIVFHIINNKVPIKNYLKGKGKGKSKYKPLQAPLIFIIATGVSIGILYQVPHFNSLYDWGNEFRNQQIGKEEQTFDYEIIDLDQKLGKHTISVEFKKGKSFRHPLIAIWVEDTLGNYIETLYISQSISSSTFQIGKKVGDGYAPATVRRPEALPYWSHKRGIKASDGLYIPLESAPDLDGVSGATPLNNFIISSKSNLENNGPFKILMEFNQSFDWNEYYSKDRFPDDKIYSGSGAVGQPSMIYKATINPEDLNHKTYKLMELIGHGHHSGQNGNLYTDLKNITTAKEIADRIILSIE
ncbi:DUF4405 domain-containing protein [Flammeovirga aprica]|uniref:DUF4405 domain-containing protein n=1 Tax=Flammeovirga aprica JL-4 TaxID=694437 RepID=A0A7X9S0E0_9BACT|nr:DUF4405 domain-containing protein [Flammeovirga aprica]NME72034.1 DUF4405 domain-containing protein [Flammeovirga aprica JL-4]